MNRLGGRCSRASGFTLVELLLVITVVVLLGGMTGGLYVGTYKGLLVEKAARQFLLMARYARIAAIQQQQPYELQMLPDKGFLLTTTRRNEESGQTEKVEVRDYYCKPVQFEGDVKFEDLKTAGSTAMAEPLADEERELKITFLPNGTAQSTLVQIGDGKRHYTIAVVASTGKASLYRELARNVRNATIDLDEQ